VTYLLQFWRFLQATFLKFDRVPNRVSPSEPISRFIFSREHIKTSRVSFAAFMPSKKTMDVSVYRTGGCGERRIWLLGDLFVAAKRKDNRGILARADLASRLIFKEGLDIVPQPSPHPRHANVTNWPSDKPQQRIKAMALANGASLQLRCPSRCT
jgi:hypothetical protein